MKVIKKKPAKLSKLIIKERLQNNLPSQADLTDSIDSHSETDAENKVDDDQNDGRNIYTGFASETKAVKKKIQRLRKDFFF